MTFKALIFKSKMTEYSTDLEYDAVHSVKDWRVFLHSIWATKKKEVVR